MIQLLLCEHWLELLTRAVKAYQPTADEETRDVVRHLTRLLDQLGARDRSLFVSRYVERMGIGEIATSHRMTFATTRRRVARMTKLVSKRARNDAALAPHFDKLASR